MEEQTATSQDPEAAGDEPKPGAKPMGLAGFLRAFCRYLRPYRLQATLIVLALLVDLIFDTAVRLSFKYLIDDVLGATPRNGRLLVIILSALAVGVVFA
jgi:ABC-type multidrug transport system fused ATPase/permease subunit